MILPSSFNWTLITDCQCPIVGYSCMRPVPYNKPILCIPTSIVGYFPNFPPESNENTLILFIFLDVFLMLILQMVNIWLFYSQSRPAQTPLLVSYRKGRREMPPTVMESRLPFPPPPLQLSAIGTNRAEEEVSAMVEPGPDKLDVTALTHGRDYYAFALADVSSNDSVKDEGENNGYAED